MQNLLTVKQAATQANVSVKTIYYHLHKSNKLAQVYYNKKLYVNAAQLQQLYKAAAAGTKQRLTTTTYKNTIAVNANTQQQAQQLIAQAQAIIAQLQTTLVV